MEKEFEKATTREYQHSLQQCEEMVLDSVQQYQHRFDTKRMDENINQSVAPHEHLQSDNIVISDECVNLDEKLNQSGLADLEYHQIVHLYNAPVNLEQHIKLDADDENNNVFAAPLEYQQRVFKCEANVDSVQHLHRNQSDSNNVLGAPYEHQNTGTQCKATAVSEEYVSMNEKHEYPNIGDATPVSDQEICIHEHENKSVLSSPHEFGFQCNLSKFLVEDINIHENIDNKTVLPYNQTSIQFDAPEVLKQHIKMDEEDKEHVNMDGQNSVLADSHKNILAAPREYEKTIRMCDATAYSDQHINLDEKINSVFSDQYEYEHTGVQETGLQCDNTLDSDQHPQRYQRTDAQYSATIISKQQGKLDELSKTKSVLSTLHEYQRAGHICESMSLLANLHQYQRAGDQGHHYCESNVASAKPVNTDLEDGQKSVLANVSLCRQTGHKCERPAFSETHLSTDLKNKKKDVSDLVHQCQQTGHLCDEISLLATLHQYRQAGHLCDVSVMSSDRREFVAHAVVLAAASSVLTQELSKCDQGHYNIVMPLNSIETETFLQFAYTGQMNASQPCDMSAVNYFCDKSDGRCPEKEIVTKLNEFSEKRLFSNVTWYNIINKMQPTNSVLLAVRYNFMSHYIKTGSIVKVNMLDSTSTLLGRKDQLNPEPIYEHTEFECITCHKHFTRKIPYKPHDSVDIRDKQYRCDKCKICVGLKVNIERLQHIHTNDKSSEYNLKKHKCKLCLLHFNTEGELKKHACVQSDDKPYMCTTCYQSFTTNHALKEHQSIYADGCKYTNVNPFMCQTCHKCFKTTKDLKLHKPIHSVAKPYKYTLCDTRCKTLDNLKSHRRVHNNDRPYTCDKCKDRFKTKMEVRMH